MEIPAAFAARKREITTALAAPAGEYHDRSPKGSVDAGIQELIALLNGLDGIVTTSSCAGRVSLFVEGSSGSSSSSSTRKPSAADSTGAATAGRGTSDNEHAAATTADAAAKRRESGGLGGRWLFVTHTPDELAQLPGCIRGLAAAPSDGAQVPGSALAAKAASASAGGAGGGGPLPPPDEALPLIRLQFEPMILHIQAASLAHARPILAAAVEAGWRESGVSSLRSLGDGKAAAAHLPVVAVRSAGLALASVVGYVDENLVFLVDDRYVQFLTLRFRERFAANARRIARFEQNVRRAMLPDGPAAFNERKKEKNAGRRRRSSRNGREPRERRGEGQGTSNEDEEEVLDGLELFGF